MLGEVVGDGEDVGMGWEQTQGRVYGYECCVELGEGAV